jgi:hypothetical protein
MQQTAVEWLVNQINSDQYQKAFGQTYISIELIEQAKEMEKEQIYKALCRGHSDCGVFTMISECEQYYNETYKQHNQIT